MKMKHFPPSVAARSNAKAHAPACKSNGSRPSPCGGFTLVEMAIVLLILALLLGSGLTVLSAQIEQQKVKDTNALLAEAREALIGHALRFGRLPCPADPTLATGAANAGLERAATATGCTGGAAALQGALPWTTLGLPELDAWGHRFTYRVSATFARSLPQTVNFNCAVAPASIPTQAVFALCSDGDMTLRSASGGNTLASAIPAVILSHGANGLRSYLPSGIQMAVSADIDEIENSNADTNFISKTPTSTYDDLLVWIAPATLANRMLQAGRLP